MANVKIGENFSAVKSIEYRYVLSCSSMIGQFCPLPMRRIGAGLKLFLNSVKYRTHYCLYIKYVRLLSQVDTDEFFIVSNENMFVGKGWV
mgnify:CR=1 FL=1